MKRIYIVLTNTGSIPSKAIRFWTKNENAHVSIGLDPELMQLYSFARVYPYLILPGGFVNEAINKGSFKRFVNTKAQIYSLPVTEEQYNKIAEIISDFDKNKKVYKFNILGLILVGFNRKWASKNKFYCAEFVKYVLSNANIEIDSDALLKPEDFKKINNLELVYQGLLREYGLEK